MMASRLAEDLFDHVASRRSDPNRIEAAAPRSTMPRPRRNDPAIVRYAAMAIAEDCVGWDPESTVEEWLEDVLGCRHEWDDGYRFASALERRAHISPDRELVEILEDAATRHSDAHRRAVRQWVVMVGFDPRFAVGDLVDAGRHGTGPVHSIDVRSAQYVVDVKRQGNGGIYVDAEDVMAAMDAPGTDRPLPEPGITA